LLLRLFAEKVLKRESQEFIPYEYINAAIKLNSSSAFDQMARKNVSANDGRDDDVPNGRAASDPPVQATDLTRRRIHVLNNEIKNV
jgi:hypothetical protein